MASALWVTLLVELLVLIYPGHGSSVAPGDEEPLCPQLRALGAAPIPAYSANMRVLMDSWNYQNLLPTRTGDVWEQVDNDENNPSGVTTNWVQQSNTPCEQSVQVCGFPAGQQNNWLITQLINRTVNGLRLSQVSVMIEFELQGCDTTLNCQRTFNTHVYETSTGNADAARNISNYRQVQRVSPDVTTGERVNKTVVINFNTTHSSFYFAIQDEASCIVITRLIVFYHVCPSQSIGLVHTPEIIAGSTPISVAGHCVENALTEDNSRLLCSPGGIWTLFGRACRCELGYMQRRVNGTDICSRRPSCESLDNLIDNHINRNELRCQRKVDCSGIQCFSQNSFLRNFVDVFDIRYLLCTNLQPFRPILWLQILSEKDPTNNNQRSVLLNRNVTQNISFDLPVMSGDLTFGVYQFVVRFLGSGEGSAIVFDIKLIRNGVTERVIDSMDIILFSTEDCFNDTPTTQTPLITTTDIPPEPVLTPPNEVQSHCSHVIWRKSPNVSCEDITGYDVRLFNPDTEEEVVRQVDATGTYHIFLPADKALTEQKSTKVQIRVASSSEKGPYSSPEEVGCFVPPPPSVYFELNRMRYDNNSAINIHAIGEGDNALLCKTNKQNCCGTWPNRFGEFYYPSGVQVPIRSADQDFYRNRGDQLIRLNRKGGASFPTGKYYCEIPDANGVDQKIFINII